jgi:hypothetical protein
MTWQFQVVLWHHEQQRHEPVLVEAKNEIEVREMFRAPGIDVRGVKRLYCVVNPSSEFLLADEACAYAGLSKTALRELVAAGSLVPVRANESADPRYLRSELDRCMAGKPLRRAAAA